MRSWIARCFRREPFLPTNSAGSSDVGKRRALTQPGAQRLHGLAAHGDDACLATLAEHANRAVGEVELRDVEADQFIEAQTG